MSRFRNVKFADLPALKEGRFVSADVPTEPGVPFAIVHFTGTKGDQHTVPIDLDKAVFLGPVEDEDLRKSAKWLATIISAQLPSPIANASLESHSNGGI
jgi:hypothetical protein